MSTHAPGSSDPRNRGGHPGMATLGPLADLPKLGLHLHVQLCIF